MKRLLGLGILVGGVFLAGSAPAQTPKVGDMVPDFTLEELRGGQVALGDYDGKVKLLFFFGHN